MSAPFERPLDALLEMLRESGLAYRCRPQVNRWSARCPCCLEHRLDVQEHGFGRNVTLRCSLGCDPDEILHRLKHPERCFACGSVHGQAAALERAACAALELAYEQQDLLRTLVQPEPGAVAA